MGETYHITPPGVEENPASPPVQEGLQATQGVHVACRLDARQDRDQMPSAMRIPGTDVLQEVLPTWSTKNYTSSKQASK